MRQTLIQKRCLKERLKRWELNVAYGVQPPSLDPHSVTDVSTRDISQHMFEPLVTLNSSLEVEPMLAESYEVNEDEETVTFYLREGIQFHNGDEMTARDVIASMERWHDYSSQAQEYLDGTEYEAIDDYTVVAHLEEYTTIDMFIFADMTQFAAIMPEEVITNAGTNLVDELIGTGPFQLEEWRQDQFIHFKKNSKIFNLEKNQQTVYLEQKSLKSMISIFIM